MTDPEIAMNPNKIVKFLKKAPEEFTKDDLIRFIRENDIQMINFRYLGSHGKLKTLNFNSAYGA